jgi:putative redox protein
MEMTIDFPGGARVDAHFGSFTVNTDQKPHKGGHGSAPTPFEIFLASLGTCAGIYVLGFCNQRGISAEDIRLVQKVETDPETGLVRKVALDIQLPSGFPEKYRSAVVRAAEQCLVKKHLENPPAVVVSTSSSERAGPDK